MEFVKMWSTVKLCNVLIFRAHVLFTLNSIVKKCCNMTKIGTHSLHFFIVRLLHIVIQYRKLEQKVNIIIETYINKSSFGIC